MIIHKGFVIGFGLGVFKIMQSIRVGTLRWTIALTDIIGSSMMGYGAWEMALAANIPMLPRIIVTVILSLNAFLAVHVFTNPQVLKQLAKTFLKIDVKIDDDK